MGIFQGKWPVRAGEEIDSKNFEDIRKLILLITWPDFGKKFTLPTYEGATEYSDAIGEGGSGELSEAIHIRYIAFGVDAAFTSKTYTGGHNITYTELANNPPIPDATKRTDTDYWDRDSWADVHFSDDNWDDTFDESDLPPDERSVWHSGEFAVHYYDMDYDDAGHKVPDEYFVLDAGVGDKNYINIQNYGPPINADGSFNFTYWSLLYDWNRYEDYDDNAGRDDFADESFHNRKRMLHHASDVDMNGEYVFKADLHTYLPKQTSHRKQRRKRRRWNDDLEVPVYEFFDRKKHGLEIEPSQLTGDLRPQWLRDAKTTLVPYMHYNKKTEMTLQWGEPSSDECDFEDGYDTQYAANTKLCKKYQDRVIHCIEMAGQSREDCASLVYNEQDEPIDVELGDTDLEDGYQFEVSLDSDWEYAFKRHDIIFMTINGGGYGGGDVADVAIQPKDTVINQYNPDTNYNKYLELPYYDSPQSIYWQCNASAFEKVLKELSRKEQSNITVSCFNRSENEVVLEGGHYDWFWDTSYAYMPRSHKFAHQWLDAAGYTNDSTHTAEKLYPLAEGCWRRVFKHTFKGLGSNPILYPGHDSWGYPTTPPDYHPRYRCVSPDTYDDIPEYYWGSGQESDQLNEFLGNFWSEDGVGGVGSGSTCEPNLDYDGGTEYSRGDFRKYNGYWYEAKQTTTGNAPTGDKTSNDYWRWYDYDNELYLRHNPVQVKGNPAKKQFEIHKDMVNDMFYALLQMSKVNAEWPFEINYYKLIKDAPRVNPTFASLEPWTSGVPFYKELHFDDAGANYARETISPYHIYKSLKGKEGSPRIPAVNNALPSPPDTSNSDWDNLGEQADAHPCNRDGLEVTDPTADCLISQFQDTIPNAVEVNANEAFDVGFIPPLDRCGFMVERDQLYDETWADDVEYSIDQTVYYRYSQFKCIQAPCLDKNPEDRQDYWDRIGDAYTHKTLVGEPELTESRPLIVSFGVRLVRKQDSSAPYSIEEDSFVARLSHKGFTPGNLDKPYGFYAGCEFGIIDSENVEHIIGGKFSEDEAADLGRIREVSVDPNNRGSGYYLHDELVVVDGGASIEGEVQVDDVTNSPGPGEVLSVRVLDWGAGHSTGIKSTNYGSGSGCKVSIDSLRGYNADYDTFETALCHFDIPSSFNPIISAMAIRKTDWSDNINYKGNLEAYMKWEPDYLIWTYSHGYLYGDDRAEWEVKCRVEFLNQNVMNINWNGYPDEAFAELESYDQGVHKLPRNFDTDVYES